MSMNVTDKQALREAAEKAQEHGVFNMDIHSGTVLALLDELEAKDIVRSAQDYQFDQQADRIESLEKKTGELGEALGTAYKRNAEQADIIAKQDKWIKEVEATVITATDRAEAAEKRIAEQEARTLTVKLPPRVDGSNVPFTAHAWNCCLDEIEKRLAAAGIALDTGE